MLGSYILLFPKSRVNVLMGRGVIPAALAVIGCGSSKFVSGVGSISQSANEGGVAYNGAHRGFIAGRP